MLALSQHLSCVTFVRRTAWLLANRAGIHVDFEAHRHFHDFRCVPRRFRHLRFSRVQGALVRRAVQVLKSYINENRNGKVIDTPFELCLSFLFVVFSRRNTRLAALAAQSQELPPAQNRSNSSASSLLVKGPFAPGQIERAKSGNHSRHRLERAAPRPSRAALPGNRRRITCAGALARRRPYVW